ncbi:TIGR03773 family transporter-associated surface protein [Streptomyces coeruleorubidus]|uniref:TIGR03773 family transporter-associated surface protein n=1 Tax=Streptomyces coeruleorubidus TaxID=116188 RepID=UPI00237FD5ED|nr:TIGR03773 family transporter-associated surface protein [Streptomyces coeruleorubidus]WDV50217.1 TIGR03773 family transporter-associated surface protein [Streptomyces coeruleorubidus]
MRGTAGRRQRIAAAVALAAAGVMTLGAAPEPRATTAAGQIVQDGQGVALDAQDRPVEVDDTHRTAVPNDETYRFLGEPGMLIWELADAPWDTTRKAAGSVRRALTGVEGPGALVGYDLNGDGEPVLRFDSRDVRPDGHDLPAGTGEGGTRWVFAAPGTYTLTFATGTGSADGEQPSSTEETYTVLVGDEAIERATQERAAEAEVPRETPSAASTGNPDADEPPATAPDAGARDWPGVRKPAVAAAPTDSADATVVSTKKTLDEGHIDLAARVVDRKMQIHIKDGTIAGKTTWREPSSVVLHVKPVAKKTIPASDDFAFLGKKGDPVWLLDQVQQDGLLWPGWSTDNIAAGATKGGVDFALTEVDGPGSYALYTYDGLSGATVLFNSRDGVPDSFTVPANSHAHGGWAFSEEGVYRLTFRMSGTLANGTEVSDTETVTFAVGDTDPGSVAPGDGSGKGGSGTSGSSDTTGSGSAADSGSGAGSGSGSTGGTSADGSGDGSMASTGAGQALLLGTAAAAFTTLGAAAVLAARRRRTARG